MLSELQTSNFGHFVSFITQHAKELLVIGAACIILLFVYIFIQNNTLSDMQIVNGSFQGVQDGMSYHATLACNSNNGDKCSFNVSYNAYCPQPQSNMDPACPTDNYQVFSAIPWFTCSGNTCNISEGTVVVGTVNESELNVVFDIPTKRVNLSLHRVSDVGGVLVG